MDRAVWIGVPVVVRGGLVAGFEPGSSRSRNLAQLDEFLSGPVVEVLPVDRDVAATFGEIIADLRRQGRPIPVNDIWIAATCARAGATLITWDAHFRSISRVSALILD